jgi:hypothetical protein
MHIYRTRASQKQQLQDSSRHYVAPALYTQDSAHIQAPARNSTCRASLGIIWRRLFTQDNERTALTRNNKKVTSPAEHRGSHKMASALYPGSWAYSWILYKYTCSTVHKMNFGDWGIRVNRCNCSWGEGGGATALFQGQMWPARFTADYILQWFRIMNSGP